MAWHLFTNGTIADATQVNDNFDYTTLALGKEGLNTIRQLQDRAIIFSKNFNEGFADAYIDSDGRLNSVNTANTTALFDVSNLEYETPVANIAPSDTTSVSARAGSWVNTANGTDNDLVTYSEVATTYVSSGSIDDWTFEKTWTGARTIGNVRIKCGWDGNTSQAGNAIVLEYFNGAWVSAGNLATDPSGAWSLAYDSTFALNQSCTGIRLRFTTDTLSSTSTTIRAVVYEIQYGIYAADALVEHTIPANTFPATISKAIGIGLLSQIETGAGMQFKLQNGTEDTGWIDCYNYPKMTRFTAFTSQPTKLIIKLIAKPTTGTAGIPAIKGFWVYAD